MNRARELADRLRRDFGLGAPDGVLVMTLAFLDDIASREESPAPGEAEVAELRQYRGMMGALAPALLALLDERARDKPALAEAKKRIAETLAVVEKWEREPFSVVGNISAATAKCIEDVKKTLTSD